MPKSSFVQFNLQSNGLALYTPQMQTIVNVNDTWTPYPGSVYRRFALGVYTLVAGDEWGNTAILNFVIKS